ncbi:hypothetical protein [Saccharopolyspora gloriosae]|uniref:hypothetical protein n=1 Tax=Saccharopolyspora gloriosae TaxID=455344 RepID=UPI001FB70BE9|nr:hypothetical protein [Saccharopolyspora gloriosae]
MARPWAVIPRTAPVSLLFSPSGDPELRAGPALAELSILEPYRRTRDRGDDGDPG